jgi:hypothetical protein
MSDVLLKQTERLNFNDRLYLPSGCYILYQFTLRYVHLELMVTTKTSFGRSSQ